MGSRGLHVEKRRSVDAGYRTLSNVGLAVAVPFSRVTSNRPPIFGHVSWHRGLYAFGVQMNPATLRLALAVAGSSSRLRGNPPVDVFDY